MTLGKPTQGAPYLTAAEEQQMLASLSEISQDIKAFVALLKDSTRKQGEADEKAYGQFVNIAHKR
jgi:hypothetical protein